MKALRGPAGQQQKADRERQALQRMEQWRQRLNELDANDELDPSLKWRDPRNLDPRVQALSNYLDSAGASSLAIGCIETLIEDGWLHADPQRNWSDLEARIEHYKQFYGHAGSGTSNTYDHVLQLIRGED